MTFIIADRVKETSITTGSGSIVLAGAFGAYQAFSATIGDTNTTFYAIENEQRWEVGIGTYTSASNTLSRDTILDSSAGGAKINMNGVSIVFCTYPADHAVFFNDQHYIDGRSQSGILLPHSSFSSSGTDLLHVTISGAMLSVPNMDSIVPVTVIKSSSGCFFHEYVDDLYDHTIALHTDGVASSTWKLGFKDSPNNPYDPPTFGYIYGKDGQVGLWGNAQNHVEITNTTGFSVTHSNKNMLIVNSTTGVYSVGSGRFDAIVFADGTIQRTSASGIFSEISNLISTNYKRHFLFMGG